MKTRGDDAPPEKERDEECHETVLVWNATVARIPARDDAAGDEGDTATPESKSPPPP